MTFNILPTLVEIVMVGGILWWFYGWTFAVITVVTITGYIAYTLLITEWRTKYRRQMNEEDQRANTHAIDSLINYETVKYFSNGAHERSEEHTSELQSLMRTSYAVFCLKKKTTRTTKIITQYTYKYMTQHTYKYA